MGRSPADKTGRARVTAVALTMPWAQGWGHVFDLDPTARLDATMSVLGENNSLRFAHDVVIGDAPVKPGPTILVDGCRNHLEIEARTKFSGSLHICGHNNRVHIGAGCTLHGVINVLTSSANVWIGDGTTMVHGGLHLHEPSQIRIGRDAMLSSEVFISVSDMHPIYDQITGGRINPPGAVTIGDHVWLGRRTMILKGSRIGSGSIIAAGAVVSGDVGDNVVAAGVPARVVREHVEWRRDFEPLANGMEAP